jgi:hypothetical protein
VKDVILLCATQYSFLDQAIGNRHTSDVNDIVCTRDAIVKLARRHGPLEVPRRLENAVFQVAEQHTRAGGREPNRVL